MVSDELRKYVVNWDFFFYVVSDGFWMNIGELLLGFLMSEFLE